MNDLKSGYGIFKWPTGRIYEGEWLEGKQHGSGKTCDKNGIIKFGLWQYGKRIKLF